MVDFKLDTSGEVELTAGGALSAHYTWTDLSPFAQGYVEALFDGFYRQEQAKARDHFPRVSEAFARYGFSDLSPEALALILKDCEVYERHYPMKPFAEYRRARGAAFWAERNSGKRTSDWSPVHFYPQAVSLGDDGKIHLSPSHEHGAAK